MHEKSILKKSETSHFEVRDQLSYLGAPCKIVVLAHRVQDPPGSRPPPQIRPLCIYKITITHEVSFKL